MKKPNLLIEAPFLLSLFAAVACASPQTPGPADGPQESAEEMPGPAEGPRESAEETPRPPDGPRESAEETPRPRIVHPGAPGDASRVVTPEELGPTTPLPYTDADVRFMQGMIPHHAQALDMAALVEDRTQNQDIHLLARRIEISQRDEIDLMGQWLEERGEAVPGPHAHHMMGDHLMPGMLTAEEMDGLAGAREDEFDQLFLELMIKHHQGALTMVRALFASQGGGQETDIYTFASHVDADQQIDIRRMRQMLEQGC